MKWAHFVLMRLSAHHPSPSGLRIRISLPTTANLKALERHHSIGTTKNIKLRAEFGAWAWCESWDTKEEMVRRFVQRRRQTGSIEQKNWETEVDGKKFSRNGDTKWRDESSWGGSVSGRETFSFLCSLSPPLRSSDSLRSETSPPPSPLDDSLQINNKASITGKQMALWIDDNLAVIILCHR